MFTDCNDMVCFWFIDISAHAHIHFTILSAMNLILWTTHSSINWPMKGGSIWDSQILVSKIVTAANKSERWNLQRNASCALDTISLDFTTAEYSSKEDLCVLYTWLYLISRKSQLVHTRHHPHREHFLTCACPVDMNGVFRLKLR